MRRLGSVAEGSFRTRRSAALQLDRLDSVTDHNGSTGEGGKGKEKEEEGGEGGGEEGTLMMLGDAVIYHGMETADDQSCDRSERPSCEVWGCRH